MKNLYIGTSGYNYNHWKGSFYPDGVAQKKWLGYYSEQFSSVEINATFYRTFAPHVYENWYNTTDTNFTFTLKGPRTITHIKRLNDVANEVHEFYSTTAQLKEKLSCVLWQFPYSFKNDENTFSLLEAFIQKIPFNIRHVFEFRHASWFTDSLYDLLHKHKAGFVINDSSRFPSKIAVTADCVYIRFHGPKALYASPYSDNELYEWSSQITKWMQNKDVYCYFNNDFGGHAFRNAQTLREMINGNMHQSQRSI